MIILLLPKTGSELESCYSKAGLPEMVLGYLDLYTSNPAGLLSINF